MAETKKLVTKINRLNSAQQMIESINEPANTAYYMFVGNHMDYANSSFIPQPKDSISETLIDVYRNMIYGKRVSENDIKLVIPRNDYSSNKVYDMYDDTVGETDIAVFNSNYYAVVNADAYYHVFKCLDNNLGVNSTVQPEFSEIDASDEVYQTSDGYVWKYMYSADVNTVRKFATTEFFPVVPNNQVISSAKNGKIDVIKVDYVGRGYDNYCNGVFRADDLRVGGNNLIYSINASLTANTTNDYYNGCYLYISAGTGVGQFKLIQNYVVNSTVKAIWLQSAFAIPPAADSYYEISPGVEIVGDGTQTSNALARAIVNTVANTIQRIEMLHTGENYKYATATVSASATVGVSNVAILRPIYSPHGGHGFNPAAELGATRACVSVKFSNTDIEIPLTNDYRTIGILKDPHFTNVSINFTTVSGIFVPDENVYQVKGTRVSDNATITIDSSEITANADFANQFVDGETIYLQTVEGYQLAYINSVTNSTHLTITTNSYYSCTATSMYKTNIGSYVSNVELSYSSLTGTLSVNASSGAVNGTSTAFLSELVANSSHVFVYGNSSGGGSLRKVLSIANNTRMTLESHVGFVNTSAKAQVVDYTVNTKTVSGIQSTVGYVTSVATGTIIAENVAGIFSTGDTIIGSLSGAVGTITTIERSGIPKGFESFVQMYKYVGTPVSSTFTPDELVYQSDFNTVEEQTANALIHSVTGTGPTTQYYVTNQVGIMNVNENMIGSNSTAVALLTNKYSPELVFGSGEVMFIEKINPIERTQTTSETIKLIFEF